MNSSARRSLAERAGILPEYIDIHGEKRRTSDETRGLLLAAMGFDASTEDAAKKALRQLDREVERRPLSPASVFVGSDRRQRLRFRVPTAFRGGRADYRFEIRTEERQVHETEGQLPLGRNQRTASLPLPESLGLGYHHGSLHLRSGDEELHTDTTLVMCPESCLSAGEVLGDRSAFGIWGHLYCLRSQKNWGAGDFGDLLELGRWAAGVGAAFVGVNPLHTLRNHGEDISPYSPISRLFGNPLYIDVPAIPEFAESEEARSLVNSQEYREALAAVRSAERVDYGRAISLKERVFEVLHGAFLERHRDRPNERGLGYAHFVDQHGDGLRDFATFMALDRHFRARGHTDWRSWPQSYRDPRSPAVDEFRREHELEVERHCYLQFEFDRQLGQVAEGVGLPIGLYGDLAIGTAANGSDPWAFPGLFVDGVSVGAPPDDYSLQGQDWGLPPLNPHRLKADGYRYWVMLLRNALRHSGALRIDHVMGLFRQYWVPSDHAATQGAYVRYPSDDLLAILALESRRKQAIIIGEDLGTVPRGLPSVLARWGILSSSVLYFERDHRGAFKSSSRYSARALVTADTHDHPPLRGYWQDRDIELRRQLGAMDEAAAEGAEAERERERLALLRRLSLEGCSMSEGECGDPYPELSEAVHCFLSKTPAPLVGVWLDDLVGETDPLNLPGLGVDKYPNWSRRLGTSLERIAESSQVSQGLRGLADRRLAP